MSETITSYCRKNSWRSRKMNAWPSMTILRGKVVVEGGVWKGALSDGKWQHRKIAEEMFSGPRL